MQVIGLDIGFGFTKATNGHETRIFKSVFGEATDLQFRDNLLKDSTPEEHLHIEVDGNGYFVGELAERQSKNRSFTLDQQEFVTGFTKVLALTALATMVEPEDPIKLVAGLPISQYQKFKDQLASALTGDHKVAMIDRSGERHDNVVSISEVRVVPQPFGSLLTQMLGDRGEVVNPRFLTEKIGIVDVGFRTTDYMIADRTRFSQRGSGTAEAGISSAFSVVSEKLKEESEINVELYRLFEAVDRGFIRIRGKKFDLSKLSEGAFGHLATAIANEANRIWADDWDMDAILLTGGGGAVLGSHLKPIVVGKVIPVEAGQDSRLSNVEGFCKYGKHLWLRNTQAPKPQSRPQKAEKPEPQTSS